MLLVDSKDSFVGHMMHIAISAFIWNIFICIICLCVSSVFFPTDFGSTKKSLKTWSDCNSCSNYESSVSLNLSQAALTEIN